MKKILSIFLILALAGCNGKITISPQFVNQLGDVIKPKQVRQYRPSADDPYDNVAYAIAKTKAPIILVGEFHEDITSLELTLHAIDVAQKYAGFKNLAIEVDNREMALIAKYPKQFYQKISLNVAKYVRLANYSGMNVYGFDLYNEAMNKKYGKKKPLKVLIGKEREGLMTRALLNGLNKRGKVVVSMGVYHLEKISENLRALGINTLNINTVSPQKLLANTQGSPELTRRSKKVLNARYAVQAY